MGQRKDLASRPSPRPKPPSRRVASRRKPVNTTPPPAPPRRNQRAQRTGGQADAANLPDFAAVVAEVQETIDAAAWLQPTDRLMLDLMTREITIYRHAQDALAKAPDVALNKKVNAQKLQLRRVRLLLQLATALGFTPESRARLGLTQAMTERAKQGVAPVRTEERAREVARLLQRSGAIPRVIDAEVVEPEPEPEPEEVVPDMPTLVDEEKVEPSALIPIAEAVRRSRKQPPPGHTRVH